MVGEPERDRCPGFRFRPWHRTSNSTVHGGSSVFDARLRAGCRSHTCRNTAWDHPAGRRVRGSGSAALAGPSGAFGTSGIGLIVRFQTFVLNLPFTLIDVVLRCRTFNFESKAVSAGFVAIRLGF